MENANLETKQKRYSIAQKFFLLATKEDGTLPAMHRDESKAGIVAAGFMDLLLQNSITVEKKKITVTGQLPNDLGHIASLYDYLSQKTRTIDKLMSDYVMVSDTRIRQLTAEIGESLLTCGAAEEGNGGLFGNKTVYIPVKDCKSELICTLKQAAVAEREVSSHDATLIYLLKETKNLNQYFSRQEEEHLKTRLNELKKDPRNRQLADMITYVEDMVTVMAACVMMYCN